LRTGSCSWSFIIPSQLLLHFAVRCIHIIHQLQHLPGSAPAQAAEQDVAMARQFFEGQQRPDGPSLVAPPYLHPAELARMAEMNRLPEFNEAWTRERYQPPVQNNVTQSSWANEFGGAQQQPISASVIQNSVTQVQMPESELPCINF
jgi:peroxin-5